MLTFFQTQHYVISCFYFPSARGIIQKSSSVRLHLFGPPQNLGEISQKEKWSWSKPTGSVWKCPLVPACPRHPGGSPPQPAKALLCVQSEECGSSTCSCSCCIQSRWASASVCQNSDGPSTAGCYLRATKKYEFMHKQLFYSGETSLFEFSLPSWQSLWQNTTGELVDSSSDLSRHIHQSDSTSLHQIEKWKHFLM